MAETHSEERLSYRISDAAKVLGISRSGFYKLVSQGLIKPVRLGTLVLVPKAELERLLHGAPAGE